MAVQCKDGRPLTHGTVVRHLSNYHDGRSYKIRVSKTGCIITRTDRHVKTTLIIAEEYLRNAVAKKDKTLGANVFG